MVLLTNVKLKNLVQKIIKQSKSDNIIEPTGYNSQAGYNVNRETNEQITRRRRGRRKQNDKE